MAFELPRSRASSARGSDRGCRAPASAACPRAHSAPRFTGCVGIAFELDGAAVARLDDAGRTPAAHSRQVRRVVRRDAGHRLVGRDEIRNELSTCRSRQQAVTAARRAAETPSTLRNSRRLTPRFRRRRRGRWSMSVVAVGAIVPRLLAVGSWSNSYDALCAAVPSAIRHVAGRAHAFGRRYSR